MNKPIKIIIGPAKTFNDIKPSTNPRPQYLAKAKEIFKLIKDWSLEDVQNKYKVSNKLAHKIFAMHQEHGVHVYDAIEVFGGMVFKQLKLEEYDKEWVNEHVLIIDPLYGPLKPYESIGLYRLDMLTPIEIDLREYWINEIREELKGCRVLNLASNEWTSWLADIELEEVLLDPSIKQIKKARGVSLHNLIKKFS